MNTYSIETLSCLEKLTESVPLSPRWSKPQVYPDDFHLGSFHLKTMGLIAEASDKVPISGSAASETSEEALERAYFELIERTSIFDVLQSSEEIFEVMDRKGNLRKLRRDQIFPVDGVSQGWKYSKSNGVAAHYDFQKAARSAALELIERDRILRSWYEGVPISEIYFVEGTSTSIYVSQLEPYYRLKAYLIGKGTPVVGFFGFPKKTEWPLLLGFGASEDPWGALGHAQREALQRLAFLWGESIPSDCPSASPSPDYHLEYYLYPSHIEKITQWLENCQQRGAEFKNLGSESPEIFPVQLEYEGSSAENGLTKDLSSDLSKDLSGDLSRDFENIWFLDITPDHLKSKIVVVKAVSDQLTPLTFGSMHPHFPRVESTRGVHPIA